MGDCVWESGSALSELLLHPRRAVVVTVLVVWLSRAAAAAADEAQSGTLRWRRSQEGGKGRGGGGQRGHRGLDLAVRSVLAP